MQKSTAPSTRKWYKVRDILLVLPADDNCAHNRYQQDNRRNFKWQYITIGSGTVEQLTDAGNVVDIGRQLTCTIACIRCSRMRAECHCKDDAESNKGADWYSCPPSPVIGVAVLRDVVCTCKHEGEQDQDGHGTCINKNLHNRDELSIEQQVDASSHRKDHYQRQCAMHDIAKTHHQQGRPHKDNGNDPKKQRSQVHKKIPPGYLGCWLVLFVLYHSLKGTGAQHAPV